MIQPARAHLAAALLSTADYLRAWGVTLPDDLEAELRAVKAAYKFDPGQVRDEQGRWTSGGGGIAGARSFSSDDPADASHGADILMAEQDVWNNSLTPGELQAIEDFTDTNYGDEVNRYMRTGETYGIPEDVVAISAEKLQAALSRASMAEDTIAYRGVGEKIYNSLEIGDEKVWRGFTSTSLAQRYADWFRTGKAKTMTVVIRQGAQAAYISRFGLFQGEYEVLLNAETHYRVIDKNDDGVTVEVNPGSTKALSPRRDRREPAQAEKSAAEERIARIFRRIFKRQRAQVLEKLQAQYPDRKSIKADIDDWFTFPDDDPDFADLIAELIEATRGGIALFGGRVKPAIDWTLTNAEAARRAREYAYELVRGINETSRDALRQVISAFVETPGMTLGNVEQEVAAMFGEQRAERISITEITRAYASGEVLAGEALQTEFPGVRIIKRWYTSQDEIVCFELCEPLAGKEVDLDEPFYEDDDPYLDGNPPRHVGCRCGVEVSTALAELD